MSDTITRQLDYYANLGVVSTDSTKYAGAIKQRDGSDFGWWLRSGTSGYDAHITQVDSYGTYLSSYATDAYGVAPAFRIG